MTLTVQKCEEHVRHQLDGKIGAPISMRELVNMTGEWLLSAHRWIFTRERDKVLIPRAEIVLTGCTWSESGPNLTLTKTGGFTGYSLVNGDYLQVDSGTGITHADTLHEILTNADANTITLKDSIGALADTLTDIGVTLPNNTVVMPANLRSIVAIDTEGAATGGFHWIGEEGFLHGETGRYSFANTYLRGSIVATRNGTTPGAVSYLLEVQPAGATPPPIRLRYTVGWVDPTLDTSVLPLPENGQLDMLFLQALFAHAAGLDKSQQGSLVDRLAALTESLYWKQMTKRDGGHRADLGRIRGTSIKRRGIPSRGDGRYINVRYP
jgi:hypothetical protein